MVIARLILISTVIVILAAGACSPAASKFSLTGRVELQDFTGTVLYLPVTLQLRKYDGTAPITRSVGLDSDGRFTLNNVDPGTYDVTLKASHWLKKLAPSVRVGSIDIGINVRDFGAIPNDGTDDTAAIQAALNAASYDYYSQQADCGGTYQSPRTVFFPAGRYTISDTLTITHANLLGEGNSILQQTNASKDIVFHDYCSRINVENMAFAGGQNQFRFNSRNADSRVTFKKCHFTCAGDCAIRMTEESSSTLTEIDNCLFQGCNQALINWGSNATINDTEIGSINTMDHKAVIENRRGRLVLNGGVYTPSIDTTKDQRWIDNCAPPPGGYSSVMCENVRFGGEQAGMTIVLNFAPYSYSQPVNPCSVILQTCELYAAGNPTHRGIVYCEEVPNQIIVRDCMGTAGIPVVTVRSSIDLNTYFDNATGRPDALRFLCDKTNTEVIIPGAFDWPEQMKPYQADQIEASAAPATGVWRQGMFIRNRNWTGVGQPFGWQCTTAGKPGVWLARYLN